MSSEKRKKKELHAAVPAVWTTLTLWRGRWTSGGVRLGVREDRDVDEDEWGGES